MRSSHPTFVYVAGYGRSGSTLLDTLLGNHPDVFGGGELAWLFQAARDRDHCSCGERLTECPFWQTVFDRVFRACPEMDCSQAAALTGRTEPLTRRGRQREQYLRLWKATCQALVEVSGKRLIVDSSKNCRRTTWRLPLLARHLGVPVKVLHLVRDPRAVMWSARRGSNRLLEAGRPARQAGGMSRGLLGWILANLSAETVLRRNPSIQATRIRYEDLANRPRQTFQRLSEFLEIDLQEIVERLDAGAPFDPGHGIQGNRMRRKGGGIKLRFDDEWQQKLPHSARRLSWIAWPLMKTYGY